MPVIKRNECEGYSCPIFSYSL